jgi:hypothetical protein
MPTAAGYASCSYKLNHAGMARNAFITFGVHPTGTNPVTIASALSTAFLPFQTQFDSNVTMIETRVSYGVDGTADTVGVVGSAFVGSRSAVSGPPNLAVLLHKHTSRGGRRGAGRMFLPWFCNASDYDELGTLTGSFLTASNTAAAQWINNLSTGGNPLVLLHRPSPPGTTHPTPEGPPDVVSSMTTDGLVSTQRRRLGR